MGGTPGDQAPDAVGPGAAAGKITAAFELLASAFEDARLDSVTLSKEDLLGQIVSAQHVLNTVWAVQAARLAQVAAIEDVRFPDHNAPLGFRDHQVAHPIGVHQDEFIGCEVGPLLGWTSGQAVGRVAEAADFITRTPRLFARVGTGEIEPAKLATIHRAIGRTVRGIGDDGDPVTIDLARKVETALLGNVDAEDDTTEGVAVVQENVDLIARQSTGRLQRRTERILRTLDPVAAGKAAKKRRRDRIGVFSHPDEEPGLTHLHAILDSATAAKLMTVIDALARELHDDTTTDKSFGECRADALADLVLGNATVTTKLIIQVPVHTGTGTGGSSCHGADTASDDTTAAGATEPTGNTGSGFWPAAFVHPITGLTVHPVGRPAAGDVASGAGFAARTTGTGVRVKSQSELDAEFNELMKTLWPPDPGDYPPGVFDQEFPPTDWHEPDRHELGRQGSDDGPPPWLHTESPGSARPAGRLHRSGTATTAWLGDGIVPGVGAIPAAVIESMCRSFGTVITRALIDADTGVTVETCETHYRPSLRLADFVRARDVHCRFPNCDRPARWCDIDHVTAWPGGPTAASNLQCLCRHHHRTKQEQHWAVTMTPHGVCAWTSPSGRTYTTTPGE